MPKKKKKPIKVKKKAKKRLVVRKALPSKKQKKKGVETKKKQQGTTVEEKIEMFLKRGKDRGFVTYAEILQGFPLIENDLETLELLYKKFEEGNVEVLETREFLDVPGEAPAGKR